MAVVVERLASHHDRAPFSCGQPQLDDWFHRRSSQDEKRNVARVFVAVDDELGVVGFYSLSSSTLALTSLPEEIARKLPRYDAIPAALVGQLARGVRARGRGIGELLLADAVRRILGVVNSVAVFAIIVDAKDEQGILFYRTFGFQPFPNHPNRLFLLTSVAAAGLQRQSRRGREGRPSR